MKPQKTIKKLLKLPLILLILGIIYLNYSTYYQPTFKKSTTSTYNQDVYQQLHFLKTKLHNGAGADMQNIFPEGFVFINSLYGLTWVSLIQDLDKNSAIFKEGMTEINWAVLQVDSPLAKQIFSKELPLKYGAFYQGWSNLLLANKLKIQAETDRDPYEVQLLVQNCNQIVVALSNSATPFLESYSQNSWPADMMVAMASVSTHDKIFEAKYQESINAWITKVKQQLDPKTQLIPHSVNSSTGQTIEGARGSSQSLILNFLIDIDEAFAKKQFEIYKTQFQDSRFGLPGIREYPKGTMGGGDIDSGPVIFGIGGAASIVGQRTMGKFKNWNTYQGLRNSIEGFGAAYTTNSKKKYIFGQLPMADAFIAWSNSIEHTENQVKPTSNWRIYFHLLSFVLIVVFGFIVLKW